MREAARCPYAHESFDGLSSHDLFLISVTENIQFARLTHRRRRSLNRSAAHDTIGAATGIGFPRKEWTWSFVILSVATHSYTHL